MASSKHRHALTWMLFTASLVLAPILGHPVDESKQTLLHSTPESQNYTNSGHDLSELALTPVDPTNAAAIRTHITNILNDPFTIDILPSETQSTSFYHDFDQDLAYGTTNTLLEGCTVLVAFTAHGFHIAHYWEDPGFGTKFQSAVISFLSRGKKRNVEQFMVGKKRKRKTIGPFPALLTEANLQTGAYIHILTTAKNASELGPNYPVKIPTLRNTIVGIQAATGGPVTPNNGPFDDAHIKETYYYTPSGIGNKAEYLFEYDHATTTARAMMTGARPRVLFVKDVSQAWNAGTDGPAVAWSNLP